MKFVPQFNVKFKVEPKPKQFGSVNQVQWGFKDVETYGSCYPGNMVHQVPRYTLLPATAAYFIIEIHQMR